MQDKFKKENLEKLVLYEDKVMTQALETNLSYIVVPADHTERTAATHYPELSKLIEDGVSEQTVKNTQQFLDLAYQILPEPDTIQSHSAADSPSGMLTDSIELYWFQDEDGLYARLYIGSEVFTLYVTPHWDTIQNGQFGQQNYTGYIKDLTIDFVNIIKTIY